MIFRRLIFYLPFVLLTISVSSFGQKSPKPLPNFTGIWSLEKTTSNEPATGGPKTTKIQLKIDQDSSSVKIHRECQFDDKEYSHDLSYYLDSRGESNPSMAGGLILETKTKLKKQTLVIEGTARWVGAKETSAREREEWKLSSDGQILTIHVDNYFIQKSSEIIFSGPYQSIEYRFKLVR